MVKPRKLNFGLNLRINESVMYVNVGELRPRDRELRYQSPGKNRNFSIENLLICFYDPKNTKRGKLKFGYNMGTNKGFMHAEFKDTRSGDHNFRGRKSAKNG